jgi:hypothetical protein
MLRKRKEQQVNCPYNDENMLREFSLGNHMQRRHVLNMTRAVEMKNQSIATDEQVYSIIEKCEKSIRVPWRHLLTDSNN